MRVHEAQESRVMSREFLALQEDAEKCLMKVKRDYHILDSDRFMPIIKEYHYGQSKNFLDNTIKRYNKFMLGMSMPNIGWSRGEELNRNLIKTLQINLSLATNKLEDDNREKGNQLKFLEKERKVEFDTYDREKRDRETWETQVKRDDTIQRQYENVFQFQEKNWSNYEDRYTEPGMLGQQQLGKERHQEREIEGSNNQFYESWKASTMGDSGDRRGQDWMRATGYYSSGGDGYQGDEINPRVYLQDSFLPGTRGFLHFFQENSKF